MKFKKSNFIWGSVFILAGIFYILEEFCGLPFNIWNFWPLIIIIPSIASIFSNGLRLLNTLGLFIGSTFLLTSFNIVKADTIDKLFVPICLIIVGIVVIFRDRFSKNKVPKFVENKFDKISKNGYSAIFSSNKVIAPHEPFTGAEINSIFGGVTLNLRDAIIVEDTIINCTCIFGGVDIFIPMGVNIKVSGLPIFGGISNKTLDYKNPNAPTLYINATCMFGGVDVK